jgi:hypothetical protein
MKAIYTGICNVKKGHEQRVFMMDPPHCGYEFVMVSARNFEEFTFRLAQSIRVPAPFLGSDPMAGEETYIFGCDPTGEITDWADRVKKFVLHHAPGWVRRHWRFTPKWLTFFDICAFGFVALGIFFSWHHVELPKFAGQMQPPFLTILEGETQPWWIFAGIFAAIGLSIFISNRTRITGIKTFFKRASSKK